MAFEHIFIEEQVKNNPITQNILKHFDHLPSTSIDNIEQFFGVVKKPYLQKRESLNIFIGNKKGQLVKEAPDAYGVSGEKHFYFVHAYNCLYECEYCYLQGYFNSPDLVLFVNHDEILKEIHRVYAQQKKQKGEQETLWFHSGEFSDSLALSHITGELPKYFETFENLPHAKLEIRTKSTQIAPLLKLSPLDNVIVSFSLAPKRQAKLYDRKAPSPAARLDSIHTLAKHGYKIGIHFDPMIDAPDFESQYQTLIHELLEVLPLEQLEYISLGVVRFSKKDFKQVKINYPKSDIHKSFFHTDTDGKVRYTRPHRFHLLNTAKNLCSKAGIPEKKIYLCMEN